MRLHTQNTSLRDTIYALCLEALFIAFCLILNGYARSEIKKKRDIFKNTVLIVLSFGLAGLSFYVTKLFIQG